MTNKVSPQDQARYREMIDHPTTRRGRLAATRLGAEVNSIVFANASVGLLRKFTPDQYCAVKDTLAEKVILPNLKQFDWAAEKMPTIFTQPEEGTLKDLPPKERAEMYANDALDHSTMFASALAGQGIGQSFLDRKAGMPSWEKDRGILGTGVFRERERYKAHGKAIVADKVTQGAAFYVWNATKPGQEFNFATQKAMAGIFNKAFGENEKSAEDRAQYWSSFGVPNMTGAVGSVFFLDGAYTKRMKELAPQAIETIKGVAEGVAKGASAIR